MFYFRKSYRDKLYLFYLQIFSRITQENHLVFYIFEVLLRVCSSQMFLLWTPSTFKPALCPEVWSHGSSSSALLVSLFSRALDTNSCRLNKMQLNSLEKCPVDTQQQANRSISRCISSLTWTQNKNKLNASHYKNICDTFLRVYLVLQAEENSPRQTNVDEDANELILTSALH